MGIFLPRVRRAGGGGVSLRTSRRMPSSVVRSRPLPASSYDKGRMTSIVRDSSIEMNGLGEGSRLVVMSTTSTGSYYCLHRVWRGVPC